MLGWMELFNIYAQKLIDSSYLVLEFKNCCAKLEPTLLCLFKPNFKLHIYTHIYLQTSTFLPFCAFKRYSQVPKVLDKSHGIWSWDNLLCVNKINTKANTFYIYQLYCRFTVDQNMGGAKSHQGEILKLW